jgi:hypothetical protein
MECHHNPAVAEDAVMQAECGERAPGDGFRRAGNQRESPCLGAVAPVLPFVNDKAAS